MDSSASKERASSPILQPEPPTTDDALIMRMFSFLGPILIPRRANSMKPFASTPDHLPLIFREKDVDTSYFSRRILRTAPPKESILIFRSWMQRLAPVYGEQWETLGLTQALQLACEDLSYVAPILSACFNFWCPTTNNFHFPYGMIDLTLLEVYAFTRLPADAEAISTGFSCPEISDAE
ncbi:hypothetical protein PIB30_051627 [Stylosanthes scabra]|uniref:Aminotransferase-like plant mobile domain-containing protein n=1 Tax=Stylosanthes scabra TaxID=79078 RepID=A0ABU6THQ5_9FABA|nr:hypothetical protein [Stylosanthes scabra]